MTERIAVYTAIAGGYDRLLPHPRIDGIDFHAWMDHPTSVAGWEIHTIDREADDHPRMAAKQYKLLPHVFLTEYDVTIWIDGSHRIVTPRLVPEAIAALGDADFMLYRHPWRDCIYDEADASLALMKYRGLPIREQVASYRDAGHPEHWGLWACGTLVRRRTDLVDRIDTEWWSEVVRWTYQDQLSLPVIFRRLGIMPREIPHHQLAPIWTRIEAHASEL